MLRTRTFVTLLLIMSTGQVSFAQIDTDVTLYWWDDVPEEIRRRSLVPDGGTIEDLVTFEISGAGAADIALDVVGEKIYWVDGVFREVGRANLDGTSPEVIVSINNERNTHPNSIAVDPASGKVYWTELCDLSCSTSTIRRANLDGTGEEILIEDTSQERFGSIALDIENGKMYWYSLEFINESNEGGIFRATLDGTGVEHVVDMPPGVGLAPLIDIALDVDESHIYWAEYYGGIDGRGRIIRANICASPCLVPVGLEDQDTVTLIEDQVLEKPTQSGIALDFLARKVYWGTHNHTSEAPFGEIYRASIDGTPTENKDSVELVQEMPSFFEPGGLALIVQAAQVAPAPPIRAPAPHHIRKNRYISIDPRGEWQANPAAHHIRVAVDSTQVNGLIGFGPWWATSPRSGAGAVSPATCLSILSPTKPAMEPDWTGCTTLHLTGCPIVTTTTYSIQAEVDGELSDEVLLDTQAKPGVKWLGDVVGTYDGNDWSAPNAAVNADDFMAGIRTFQDPNSPIATHLSVTDIHPIQNGRQINLLVNMNDVFQIIQGFMGIEYNEEYGGPDLTQCEDPD